MSCLTPLPLPVALACAWNTCVEHCGSNSRFIFPLTESRTQHNKYTGRKEYCLSYPMLFQSLCLWLYRSPLKTPKKNISPYFWNVIVDFSYIVNKEPWTVNLFIINGFGICPNKTSRHLLKFNYNFSSTSLPLSTHWLFAGASLAVHCLPYNTIQCLLQAMVLILSTTNASFN